MARRADEACRSLAEGSIISQIPQLSCAFATPEFNIRFRNRILLHAAWKGEEAEYEVRCVRSHGRR